MHSYQEAVLFYFRLVRRVSWPSRRERNSGHARCSVSSPQNFPVPLLTSYIRVIRGLPIEGWSIQIAIILLRGLDLRGTFSGTPDW